MLILSKYKREILIAVIAIAATFLLSNLYQSWKDRKLEKELAVAEEKIRLTEQERRNAERQRDADREARINEKAYYKLLEKQVEELIKERDSYKREVKLQENKLSETLSRRPIRVTDASDKSDDFIRAEYERAIKRRAEGDGSKPQQ